MRVSVFLVGAAVLAASGAQAATVSYTSNIVTDTAHASNVTLNLQQFNPSLGALTGVEVTLYGDVSGNARAQNLSYSPSTVTLDLATEFTIGRLDGSSIVVTSSAMNQVSQLAAFGNQLNFSGTSGVTYNSSTGSKHNTATIASSDFGLFTGNGTVSGTLSSNGTSYAQSGANILTLFQTSATGYATVTYTYSPITNAVPEPAALALLGLGVGALGIKRRRNG